LCAGSSLRAWCAGRGVWARPWPRAGATSAWASASCSASRGPRSAGRPSSVGAGGPGRG
ncbi:unnamed protein product, partial [Heterosigma akashiwo]